MYYPIKFIPVYKNYIWGGRYFERFGRELPEGKLAESWELSCHKNGVSTAANGSFQGQLLTDIVKTDPLNILGKNFPAGCQEVPLLIKLIDANENLSVQVHPDDNYAAVFEGGIGKNEIWYIMDAHPGAKLVTGLKPGVTREAFLQSIQEGRIEECLQKVEVQSGDVIHIPCGQLHSIGAGIVVAEIQQTSDITYRIFDYNRVDGSGMRRPLHIDKALSVVDFNRAVCQTKIPGVEITLDDAGTKTVYLANSFFALEKYYLDGNTSETTDGSKFYVYLCLEGKGKVLSDEMDVDFTAGETFLIPASMGDYTLKGRFTALKTYVPDLRADIIGSMREAGCSNEQILTILSR